ncbi:MAG: Crp/Fnr family transcriptional regulator [Actinomycetota bacterium]
MPDAGSARRRSALRARGSSAGTGTARGTRTRRLHLVISGAVAVVRRRETATAVARRGPGDVVGEMSIITRRPRIASLVAQGDVRTLRIGHREFESMIRERPDVSLAVMRVLAERLGAETTERTGPTTTEAAAMSISGKLP